MIQPTFGEALRAFRLGYRWSEKYERWVKIGSDGPPFRIEVHVGLVPASRGASKIKETHVAWWDGAPDILDLIEDLALHENETFYVDEEGRRVR